MSHGFADFSNPVFVGLKNCREYVSVKTITEPYSAIQITTFNRAQNIDIFKRDHMQLYVDSNFASPYAMSAFVCLRTKEIDFDLKVIDLGSHQNLSADYVHRSITSRVPTLVEGNFSLSESSAIAEYLEEIHPTPNVYPSNVQDRAKARQVQAWLRSDLLALCEDRTTEVIFYKPSLIALTPAGKLAAEKLIQVATLLLGDGRQNLFGSWSIADTDLALMLNRLIFNDDPVPEFLKRYAEIQWRNQAIREWVKMTRPVVR